MASPTPNDFDFHMTLLQPGPKSQELQEARTAPIFTKPVLGHVEKELSDNSKTCFPQYGLLAGLSDYLDENSPSHGRDPRVFFNVASPSSTFICGSQGSGKSHTLSCMLENCLLPSRAAKLPHPLTGLVFHYDTFISDDGGSPCEAAFLSDPAIKVRVLCSPANVRNIQVSLTTTQKSQPTNII